MSEFSLGSRLQFRLSLFGMKVSQAGWLSYYYAKLATCLLAICRFGLNLGRYNPCYGERGKK